MTNRNNIKSKDKLDIPTKELFKDNEVFADVFNYYFYDGKQVIKPEDLKELDSNESILSEIGKDQKIRDVLKEFTIKKDDNYTYVVLGVENQSYVDYALPVRIMLYNAYRYNKQLQKYRKLYTGNNKNDKIKLTGDEFLSRFRKEDKLKPVISLVIYYGEKAWDGPRKLSDMLDIDSKLLKYVSDYKICILEFTPNMPIEEANKFNSELNLISKCIIYKDEPVKIHEVLRQRRISIAAYKIIEALGTKEDIEQDIEIEENEGGKIDMGYFIDELVEKGRQEGLLEGKLEGKIEGKLLSLIELVKDGLLTVGQAAVRVNLSEEQFQTLMAKTEC